MNAAETIQAAIDKLTRLRAKASPGPWAAWKKPISTLYRTDLVKYGLEDARGVDMFEAQSPENAHLIETLHATIDAQLAILQEAIEYRNRLQRDGVEFTEAEGAAVHRLARAIVGLQVTDD